MKSLNPFLLFPDHRRLSFSILALTAGVGALFSITNTMPHVDTNLVTAELKALQMNMEGLKTSLNKPTDLSAVTQQMQQLSQQLERVRTQNTSHINEALNKTEALLVSRLDALQALIHHLEEKKMPITYLSPEHLPFQIFSLDSIQNIPVASVFYDFKTVPLEKGDSIAGWRIVGIDYGKQRIEFENTQQARVLVTHEHIG